MKNKYHIYICLVVSTLACFILFYLKTIRLENADMLTDAYRFRDNIYMAVYGYCEKDKPLAKVYDVVLYSVKGDPSLIYLTDSLTHSLYLKEGVSVPETDLSGVFINNNYTEDTAMLGFINSIFDKSDDSGEKSISRKDILETYSVSLCYDNYHASQKFAGNIVKTEEGYFYTDESEAHKLINEDYKNIIVKSIDDVYIKVLSNYCK